MIPEPRGNSLLFAIIGLVVIALILGIRYATSMPGTSHGGPLPPPTSLEQEVCARLRVHVAALGKTIGERNVWRPDALEQAAQYIGHALENAGYEVGSQPFDASGHAVRNVEAMHQGATRPHEIVVVGAHYDSVPGCPGANDNGSGVAGMLELARLFHARSTDRSIRFVAFVNEEPPFCFTRDMGSRVYAKRCRQSGEDVTAMLSLETIGYYADRKGSQQYPLPFGLFYPKVGNFIGFVGNLSSRRLVRRCVGVFREQAAFPSEGVAAPGYLPGIFWSDHWSFWREGYKAVMVTDTAPFRYPYYHTPMDTLDKIDYERTARVVAGLAGVVEALSRP